MQTNDPSPTTLILNEVAAGDRSAANRLFPLLYDELREIAGAYLRREKAGHVLQSTALVHEAFMKLVDQTRVNWKGKTHFLAVGAQVMRRILVDHARHDQRVKRGGGRQRITLEDHVALSPERDEDLLAVEDALVKLEKIDSRQAKIVELRFFGGMTVAEVAEVLEVSKRTVEAEWTVVRAWLRRELREGDTP